MERSARVRWEGRDFRLSVLTASACYDGKLERLADLFPGGCTVLSTRQRDFPERLDAAVRDAWETADERRAGLLAAAEQQIAAARRACGRFGAALPVS